MIIMTYHGYCTRMIRCQVLLFVLEDIWSETKSWQGCHSPDKCPQPLLIVSFPTDCPGYYDEKYSSFRLARAACLADDNCAAVMDSDGRGNEFCRCPKNLNMLPDTVSPRNCIHLRPGTL